MKQGSKNLADRITDAVRDMHNPLGNPTHGYHCGWLSGREDALKMMLAVLASTTLSEAEGEIVKRLRKYNQGLREDGGDYLTLGPGLPLLIEAADLIDRLTSGEGR